jgi:hypothetical protein
MASGQQSTPVAKAHKESLHRLVEGTQELVGEDRISVTTALTPDESTTLIEAITAQYRSDRGAWNVKSEKELHDDVADTRVKLIDLNGDGIPEVIAQASDDVSCSPTGNCTIWVFMRSSHGYKQILQRNAVQTFAILPTRTNGFNDLILGQHGSASEQALYIYHFANGRYNKDSCYTASWERLVGDELQELKNPIITPCNR